MLHQSSTTERQPSVLIVDDEPQIVDFLQMGFAYEGFSVFAAHTGPEAVQAAAAHKPAIIMLTAKDEIDDRVAGLDIGADDYVTKPFAFKELMARVRAVLRRRGNNIGDILTFGGITLDRGTRVVTSDGQPIELTPREFDLLELFLLHPRQVLTRDIILSRVWGYDYFGDDNIIEVYIRHLREKLHDNPPQLLQTVRGIGYSLRG